MLLCAGVASTVNTERKRMLMAGLRRAFLWTNPMLLNSEKPGNVFRSPQTAGAEHRCARAPGMSSRANEEADDVPKRKTPQGWSPLSASGLGDIVLRRLEREQRA